jgi:ABC-type transport system involved in multi-copper enzyme maturation permease subunit
MRGVLLKILHEVWLSVLLFGLGLFVVKLLLTFILPPINEALGEILQRVPFARMFVTVLLGNTLGAEITSRSMQAFLYVHPVVLTLVWALAVTLCTRMPAAEIDRGTIDVLLSWPISRRAVYACESIVWLAAGCFVLLMGFAGHLAAAPTMPEELRPDVSRSLIVLTNLYCVYLAVGGIALFIASLSDRRGRAIAVVFAILLASFLLNFVANFWQPAKQVSFLGILEYYRPAEILLHGRFPAGDVAVLIAVAVITWLAGGEIVARRSITTV